MKVWAHNDKWLRASNVQHAKYQAQFEQINTRLNQLNINAVDHPPDCPIRSRTPSLHRVRFDTRQSSPPAYRYNSRRDSLCFRCGKPENAYHNTANSVKELRCEISSGKSVSL